MSIKALALELYRAQQKVDMVKRKIETCSGEEQENLENELKAAKKEWQVLRKMLDGRKESGSAVKKFGQSRSFI